MTDQTTIRENVLTAQLDAIKTGIELIHELRNSGKMPALAAAVAETALIREWNALNSALSYGG